MITKPLTIINKLGIHARAAAQFVACASAFQAEVKVIFNGRTVNGKSIMGLMMLAAAKDSTITVSADGVDEIAVLAALEALIGNYFGEGE